MLTLVLRQSLVLILAGTVLGLIAAVGLTRLLANLLFGVSATDLPTFAAAALLLGGVPVVASFIPARRATRVDPMVALHWD